MPRGNRPRARHGRRNHNHVATASTTDNDDDDAANDYIRNAGLDDSFATSAWAASLAATELGADSTSNVSQNTTKTNNNIQPTLDVAFVRGNPLLPVAQSSSTNNRTSSSSSSSSHGSSSLSNSSTNEQDEHTSPRIPVTNSAKTPKTPDPPIPSIPTETAEALFFIDTNGMSAEDTERVIENATPTAITKAESPSKKPDTHPNWSDICISEESDNQQQQITNQYNGMSKTQHKKWIKAQNKDVRAAKAAKTLQLELLNAQFGTANKSMSNGRPPTTGKGKLSKKGKHRTPVYDNALTAPTSPIVKLTKKEQKRLEKQMKRLKLREYANVTMQNYNNGLKDRETQIGNIQKEYVRKNGNKPERNGDRGVNPKKEQRYINTLYDTDPDADTATVEMMHNEFIHFYDKNHEALELIRGGRGKTENGSGGWVDSTVPPKMVRFLHIINRLVHNFVENPQRQTHTLPGMNPQVRRWAILIAKQYNVKCKTQGNGATKTFILVRTQQVSIPEDWDTIVERCILRVNDSELQSMSTVNARKNATAKEESSIITSLIESMNPDMADADDLVLELPASQRTKGKLRLLSKKHNISQRRQEKPDIDAPSNDVGTDNKGGVSSSGDVNIESDENVSKEAQDAAELAMLFGESEEEESSSEFNTISSDDSDSDDESFDSEDLSDDDSAGVDNEPGFDIEEGSLNSSDLDSDEFIEGLTDDYDDDEDSDEDESEEGETKLSGGRRTEVYQMNKAYKKGGDEPMFVKKHRGGSIPHAILRQQPHANTAQMRNMLVAQILQDRNAASRSRQSARRARRGFGARDQRAAVPMVGDAVGQHAQPLDTANKGHRLLQSLGWTPGQTLGTTGAGLQAPVDAFVRSKRSGLGHP